MINIAYKYLQGMMSSLISIRSSFKEAAKQTSSLLLLAAECGFQNSLAESTFACCVQPQLKVICFSRKLYISKNEDRMRPAVRPRTQ